MEPSRIEQREELMLALLELIAPIKRLIESDDPRDHWRAAFVRQDFKRDWAVFYEDVRNFCRVGDYFFEAEWERVYTFSQMFEQFLNQLDNPTTRAEARIRFDELLGRVKGHIRTIPCEDYATVIPPASPFSASRRIRAICADAETRIDLFDPWLSAEVFYRYLPVISPNIALTVITEAVSPTDTRKRERERWEGVKAVAPLVEGEYPQFRLLVLDSLHDRWLRVDDIAYHLGGSVKDAGKNDPYTISTLDQHLYPRLDDLVARAQPWK